MPSPATRTVPSSVTHTIEDSARRLDKIRNIERLEFSNGSLGLIVGTQNNDVLNGTAQDDLILGLDGNDVLNGFAGNDILVGVRTPPSPETTQITSTHKR